MLTLSASCSRIIYVIWQAAAAAKNRFELKIVYSKAKRTIKVSELEVSKWRATL